VIEMSDYITKLARRADSVTPPAGGFEDVLRRMERRRHRNRIIRKTAVSLGGLVLFGVVLLLVVRAFEPASRVPTYGGEPSPIGTAPAGIGPIQTIRAFSPRVAVAVTDHDVIATVDDGDHWHSIAPANLPAGDRYQGFFLDRQHGWIEAVGDGGAIAMFQTVDGGVTWTEGTLTAPSKSLLSGNIFPFGFWDKTHGWLAITSSIPTPLFFSDDGGKTWREGPLIDPGESKNSDQLNALTFTSAHDGWAVIQHDIPIPNGDREIDYMMRTRDGGATWSRVQLPLPPDGSTDVPTGEMLRVPNQVGADTLVIPAWMYEAGAERQFAYVSGDGGATWNTTVPVPFARNGVSPVYDWSIVSTTTWAISSVNTNQIALTTDGGFTWSILNPGGMAQAPDGIEFTSDRSGWAVTCRAWSSDLGPVTCVGPASLYRTSDGGASWTLVLSNQAHS